ncbi:MAG: hypothetical protein NVSMB9_05840 [Isosphaeraceae bacterium]
MPRFQRPEPWVFLILLGSYAYYWQSRDWNSASRLMLTYAIVDRGTVVINGLEDQTHDRAYVGGFFYSDKLPGFSLLGTLPYSLSKRIFQFPDHPVGIAGFSHWPADYWVTLGTSGFLTALTGVLLVGVARDLGCGPRRSALVGLAYGLATPAYVYATLSYGHQASAFALLAALVLIWRKDSSRLDLRIGVAGFLASYASVIELQVGPVSAVLGIFLIVQVLRGERRPSVLADFAVGALLAALLLLAYNQLAFGSPWDMGYFHHGTKLFADVHSPENPLGLQRPQMARALTLIWGRYRGLLFYAPIVGLVPLGLVAMAVRQQRQLAVVCTLMMASVFTVNLSYPEWTGGWSTGPRLLVPLLPFAMIPVAGFLAWGGRVALMAALLLSLAGGILMLLFVTVGGRIPQYYQEPLFQAVWPLWGGREVVGWIGEPFARNLFRLMAPRVWRGLPSHARWLQFAPLVLIQGLAILMMARRIRSRPTAPSKEGFSQT